MMNSIVCVTGGVCHALVGGWWGQMDKTMVESAESASQVVTETAAAAELAPADLVWVLISSALVLMMTAPGLALFYGGLVRKKNILSVMMQCISLMGGMSLVWVLLGYSLCFSGDAGSMGFIGDLGYAGLKGVMATFTGGTHDVPMEGAIPKLLHCIFQMMFFIITPALICGAFAERMTFRAMLAFCVLWGLIVYCPVAHWVWSGSGWCSEFNPQAVIKAYDFAGGTVVHITSGVSALICALLLGHRLGYGSEPMPPHNLSYTFIGATLLWVGWFGFNAGSALGANYSAVNAFMATHLSAAAGAIVWPLLEWIFRGKPSVLGACSGCVAGLVCVTPACGTCTPLGGIVLGACAGAVCYWACTSLKNQCGYDDTLDAFGVHGVGGTLGAILTGVFADPSVTGDAAKAGLLTGAPGQVVAQALAAGAAIVWSVVITAVILKVIDVTLGLRVPQAGELQGLDIHEHGEEGYIFL